MWLDGILGAGMGDVGYSDISNVDVIGRMLKCAKSGHGAVRYLAFSLSAMFVHEQLQRAHPVGVWTDLHPVRSFALAK